MEVLDKAIVYKVILIYFDRYSNNKWVPDIEREIHQFILLFLFL
jgi:hypothetical protein